MATCSHVVAVGPSGECILCGPDTTGDELSLDDLARQYLAWKCQRSLAEFVRRAWVVLEPSIQLEWSWHLQVICDHVQATFEELLAARADPAYVMRWSNLLINVPPRSAKTMIVGILAPVWLWLHDPSIRVRYASGNSRMVAHTSRASRDLIASEWFQQTFAPQWVVRQDIDAIGLYANTERGERRSNTFEQRVVGEGTECILVDDPVDPEEAHSSVARDKVATVWNGSLANRVNSPRAHVRIGIMQRLHEEDWSAIVLGQGFRHLCLQMVKDESPACTCTDCRRGETIIGWRDERQVGEVLHPERFTPAYLDGERARLGSYGWAGQMQQRPAPEGGGIFKREHFALVEFANLPKMDRVVISLDANAKKTANGSRAALLAVGASRSTRYVLDAWAAREGLAAIEKAIREMVARLASSGLKVTKLLVEDKALGPSVVERMTDEMRLLNIAIETVNPGDNKVSRATAVQPMIEAKNVALVKGAPWADEVLHELTVFPNGATDDYVDALTQVLTHLHEVRAPVRLYKLY